MCSNIPITNYQSFSTSGLVCLRIFDKLDFLLLFFSRSSRLKLDLFCYIFLYSYMKNDFLQKKILKKFHEFSTKGFFQYLINSIVFVVFSRFSSFKFSCFVRFPFIPVRKTISYELVIKVYRCQFGDIG